VPKGLFLMKRWRRGRTQHGFQQILRSLPLSPGIGVGVGGLLERGKVALKKGKPLSYPTQFGFSPN